MAQPGRRQAGRDTVGAVAAEASPLSDADEAGLATGPLLPAAAAAPAVEATAAEDEDVAGEGYPVGRPVVGDLGGPVDGE